MITSIETAAVRSERDTSTALELDFLPGYAQWVASPRIIRSTGPLADARQPVGRPRWLPAEAILDGPS